MASEAHIPQFAVLLAKDASAHPPLRLLAWSSPGSVTENFGDHELALLGLCLDHVVLDDGDDESIRAIVEQSANGSVSTDQFET